VTFVVSAGVANREERVTCLSDSGATSSSVSKRTVERFGLPQQHMASRRICMPDGCEQDSTVICSLPLRENGFSVVVPRLVADLDSHEVILGKPFWAHTDADLS
jgi:Retroviral aspartyl protease